MAGVSRLHLNDGTPVAPSAVATLLRETEAELHRVCIDVDRQALRSGQFDASRRLHSLRDNIAGARRALRSSAAAAAAHARSTSGPRERPIDRCA
jgi:hypothetical protein